MSLDVYRAHLRRRLHQAGVPHGLREGLVEYVATRRPTGAFLRAVLCNNLREACGRADPESFAGLSALVIFLVNYVPADAWGSPDAVAAWLADPEPAPELYE